MTKMHHFAAHHDWSSVRGKDRAAGDTTMVLEGRLLAQSSTVPRDAPRLAGGAWRATDIVRL
ncbi:MAG: hypothetical protein WDN01_22315 [Rhizomicrobium sp.]